MFGTHHRNRHLRCPSGSAAHRRGPLFSLPVLAILFASALGLLLPRSLESAGNTAGYGSSSGDPKTIIDLQPFRAASSIRIPGPGAAESRATLINLNPSVNVWHILQINRAGGLPETYHLENIRPRHQHLTLDEKNPAGIVIDSGKAKTFCDLWGSGSRDNLTAARKSGIAYAPLCEGKVYLLNPAKGYQTAIEKVTDFLRKEVPGGEEIITAVRNIFFNYLYRQKAEERPAAMPSAGPPMMTAEKGPAPALVDEKEAGRLVKPTDLGIELRDAVPNGMAPGAWYSAKNNPDVYVSVIAPRWIAPNIMLSYRNTVRELDAVESEGLVTLAAFDLARFDLKYTLGTDHPGLGWSERVLPRMRDSSLPGPDGIAGSAPLVRSGRVSPQDIARTAATFTGGFKRYHGAFRYGPLSLKNHGSHYGFLENGVVFSRLQPDLSTIYALNDGRVDMKTWSRADDEHLAELRYARQNGVPLIAGVDAAGAMSVPGPLVGQWGPGNWSGSTKGDLRTMRSGIGLQESAGKRFLLYAFFWNATPSAMARVFQAYRVRHAMLLDMNALVHTYLAIYRSQGSDVYVQHLIRGMEEADMSVKGRRLPRFLAYADNRDFFSLVRKESP